MYSTESYSLTDLTYEYENVYVCIDSYSLLTLISVVDRLYSITCARVSYPFEVRPVRVDYALCSRMHSADLTHECKCSHENRTEHFTVYSTFQSAHERVITCTGRCSQWVLYAGAMNGALSDSGSSRDMGAGGGVRWEHCGAGGGAHGGLAGALGGGGCGPGGLGVPMTRAERRMVHIKKPLNAFMLFMRDQRAKVMAESSLKESAAINQLLGARALCPLLSAFDPLPSTLLYTFLFSSAHTRSNSRLFVQYFFPNAY